MKVAVIGSGVYGKAMSKVLLEAKNDVTVWTEQINLKDIILPEGAKITNEFEVVLDGAEIVFILTGSKFVESVLEGMKSHLDKETIVVLGSKGILDNGVILTDLASNIIPDNPIAVISGPTFAVDIAALDPVGFTIGTRKVESFQKIKNALKTVHLEYSDDVNAIEMCGSLKNAYAIGSGVFQGFEYGPSTRCLYITRVLEEIESIFTTLGYKKESCMTLAGIGDLVLTCTSQNSRNFTFGTVLALGSEDQVKDYLKNNTVEGYENLKAYVKLFKEKGIDAPIMECVYKIVSHEIDSSNLVELILK